MRENEEFLEERLKKEGQTNLGVYYLKFREDKNNKDQVIMVPPSANMPILTAPPPIQDSVQTQNDNLRGNCISHRSNLKSHNLRCMGESNRLSE